MSERKDILKELKILEKEMTEDDLNYDLEKKYNELIDELKPYFEDNEKFNFIVECGFITDMIFFLEAIKKRASI